MKQRKKRKALSPTDKAVAIRMYGCGKVLREIGVLLDCSIPTVAKAVHESGVPIRHTPRLLPSEKESILENYRGGLGSVGIAKKCGRSLGAILSTLRRAGERIRTPDEYRKYALNELAFANATTDPLAAYWAGFLMADGTVTEHSGSYAIELALAVIDTGHVESFRDFLASDYPVTERTGRDLGYGPGLIARVTAYSDKLGSDLVALGICPRKSATAASHGLESIPSFWTGVADGDGTIDYHRNRSGSYARLRVYGSRPLMDQYRAFIRPFVPECCAEVRPHSGIWSVSLQGKSAMPIIRLLYEDAPFSLPRKLAVAREILAVCNDGGKVGLIV